MPQESLDSVRSAMDAGDYALAIKMGWRLASDSALQRDAEGMTTLGVLAAQMASVSGGRLAADAERLSAYCAASAQSPHEAIASFFSLKRWFAKAEPRKKCPDCAEQIAMDARVCRFCGYRYPTGAAQ